MAHRNRPIPPPNTKLKALMVKKLGHAQKILEGIALGDFKLIARHADELVRLSKQAEWMVMQTPKYQLYSDDFRRAAEELNSNAKKRKLDAATLSYMELTMSCVHCHQYVRETHEARLRDGPGTRALAGR